MGSFTQFGLVLSILFVSSSIQAEVKQVEDLFTPDAKQKTQAGAFEETLEVESVSLESLLESGIEREIEAVDAHLDDFGDQYSEEQERRELDRLIRTSHLKIPIEINQNVKKWIRYFAQDDKERFARFLTRGMGYRKMVEQVMKQRKMPIELYYLAMIESGYSTQAVSSARAVGIWQFMKPTGKQYGLKIHRRADERKDPYRSTVAASRYLSDLHRRFSSWYLAIAAYNAGEGRIERAIAKGKSRDFWTLARRGALPQETMDYLPKFLAAVLIGTHPERYGFKSRGNVYLWVGTN